MKKLLLIVLASLTLLAGCKKKPHWSYESCVERIVYVNGFITYDYTVKQIDHSEKSVGDDEVYCFDITVTSGKTVIRYCCFTIVSDNEVIYVDCDKWEE